MKITVLFENTTTDECLEYGHGLSLYIEANGKKILFDMGQDDSFITNAEALGIRIENTDFAIISHGHYDHGGGLNAFLETFPQIPVYISQNAFGNYYSGYEKYIGLDPSLDQSRFILTNEYKSLSPGLSLVTLKSRDIIHTMQNNGMLIKKSGEFHTDTFEHEHYLMINENGKKTVISGCSHRGIANISDAFSPDNIVGGFHFSKLSPLDPIISDTAHHLIQGGCNYYTCHCTGKEQYLKMKHIMKDNLHYISTGNIIEI